MKSLSNRQDCADKEDQVEVAKTIRILRHVMAYINDDYDYLTFTVIKRSPSSVLILSFTDIF